jgi:cytochrome c5
MVYAALVFWLGLVIALRGGPSGAREALHAESRTARRVRVTAIVLASAFGVVVPVVIMVTNNADKAKAGPVGITLTAAQANGRTLFAKSCATCHTLAGSAAVGRVGPNLDVRMDQVGVSTTAREAVVLAAIQGGFARGNNEMPALLYTGKDAADIASYIAAVGGH